MGVADITTAENDAPPSPEHVVLIEPTTPCPMIARMVNVEAPPEPSSGSLKSVQGVLPQTGLTNRQLTDPLSSPLIIPVNTTEYHAGGNPLCPRNVTTTWGAAFHERSWPVLLT
jgi:hypothetical protein